MTAGGLLIDSSNGRDVREDTRRAFPIMDERRRGRIGDAAPLVTKVSWSTIEPLRKSCMKLHDQTLDELAARGGLSPFEVWCHVTKRNPFAASTRSAAPSPDELRAWLLDLDAEVSP